MMQDTQHRKILILSANPRGTSKLRLDEEKREIREGLRRSKQRDQYSIDTAEAVRYRYIHRAILDYEPNIIHFSGHGSGEEGLVFEDETGQIKLVDAEALAELFALFADQVECVVLNACYSEVQADAINKHVKYVIGMNQAIRDDAAIAFSIGFYRALGFGRSFEDAFKFGKNAIQLAIEDASKNRDEIAEEVRKLVPIDDVSETFIVQERLKPVLKVNSDLLSIGAKVMPQERKVLTTGERRRLKTELSRSV